MKINHWRLVSVHVLSFSLALLPATPSWSGLTRDEVRKQDACADKAEKEDVNGAIMYPLRVTSVAGVAGLAVYVDKPRWERTDRALRIGIMRDIACAYARGSVKREDWFDFSAVDYLSNKSIEFFPSDELWAARRHSLSR